MKPATLCARHRVLPWRLAAAGCLLARGSPGDARADDRRGSVGQKRLSRSSFIYYLLGFKGTSTCSDLHQLVDHLVDVASVVEDVPFGEQEVEKDDVPVTCAPAPDDHVGGAPAQLPDWCFDYD